VASFPEAQRTPRLVIGTLQRKLLKVTPFFVSQFAKVEASTEVP